MRSSTTFATLSLLVSLAMITAAPAQSPQSTIKDLTKEENQLQGLKGSDKKLDGQTSGLSKDINKELATIGKQEGKLAGLKSKDAAVEKKEKAAGKKINSDVKQLGVKSPKGKGAKKPHAKGGKGGKKGGKSHKGGKKPSANKKPKTPKAASKKLKARDEFESTLRLAMFLSLRSVILSTWKSALHGLSWMTWS
ncbi:hypothetical protein C8J56DRAFT_940183, partial [Mycena floridula]